VLRNTHGEWISQQGGSFAFTVKRADIPQIHLAGLVPARTAQDLRCPRSMEAIQSYPGLLSEKQAAARLGVARITLLRAREAGRIRFFRIGTRVLYCEDHLSEFLRSCERNGGNHHDRASSGAERKSATRKHNLVSPTRQKPTGTDDLYSFDEKPNDAQVSLPFLATR
jgi:excisionase family DNA binding protein